MSSEVVSELGQCFLVLLPAAGWKCETKRWEEGKEEPHQLLGHDLSWGAESQGPVFVPV